LAHSTQIRPTNLHRSFGTSPSNPPPPVTSHYLVCTVANSSIINSNMPCRSRRSWTRNDVAASPVMPHTLPSSDGKPLPLRCHSHMC
jgi:hypothetical protein